MSRCSSIWSRAFHVSAVHHVCTLILHACQVSLPITRHCVCVCVCARITSYLQKSNYPKVKLAAEPHCAAHHCKMPTPGCQHWHKRKVEWSRDIVGPPVFRPALLRLRQEGWEERPEQGGPPPTKCIPHRAHGSWATKQGKAGSSAGAGTHFYVHRLAVGPLRKCQLILPLQSL